MTPAAWLTAVALALAPPAKAHSFPGFEESTEARAARYASIAADIAATVERDGAAPGLTKPQSAALLLALAVEETGLDADADLGPACFRGVWAGRSWAWRCDSGFAVGIVQLHVPRAEQGAYFADRSRLLRVGYKRMRRALGSKCADEDRLSTLARGCADARSVLGSRRVFALFRSALGVAVVPEWPAPSEAGR